MQTLSKIIIPTLSAFVFLFTLAKIQPVLGQCTTCTCYITHSYKCGGGASSYAPGWCTDYECCNGDTCNGTCGPGTYQCNGGCCDIQITPPPDTGGPGGPGSCSITAPTNLGVTPTSATSSHLTWTPGTGGTSQAIFVGANQTEVNSGCPGLASPSCVVSTTVSGSQSSYDTGNVLSTGTIYYYKIFNLDTFNNCSAGSNTKIALSSCLISPSGSITIPFGGNQNISTQVNSSSAITNVFYSLSPTGYASFNSVGFVSTLTDASYPYGTTAYGLASGSTQITSEVNSASGTLCTDTATINVSSPQAWWQVKDSDVQSNGGLSSDVPSGEYFGDVGDGTYPGVPAAATAPTFGLGTASQIGWVAQSSWLGSKIFDYQYFANLIPEEALIHIYNLGSVNLDQSVIDANSDNYPGTGTNTNYLWYRYDGNQHSGSALTVSGTISVGTKKIILLVENADLQIDNPIRQITRGSGFFMAIVNGSIMINPSVGGGSPDLEGLYVADNSFQDGTNQPGASDVAFHLRGAAVAYGEDGGLTIVLERNLGGDTNGTAPSELFEYAPDQLMLFPSILGYRKLNWKEVAP